MSKTPDRTRPRALGAAALLLALMGCSSALHAVTGPRERQPVTAGAYELHTLPEGGMSWLWNAIEHAKSRVYVVVYELTDDEVIDRLVSAHDRGVDVRVLLDKAYQGGPANAAAHDKLDAAGVPVKWAGGVIVHQKTVLVDDAATIGTGNLTRTWRGTRDMWITSRAREQVDAIAATFADDWDRAPKLGQAHAAPGLLWSPGAADALVSAAQRASTRVDVTSEEFQASEFRGGRVLQAIAAAAKRGVPCRVLANGEPQWAHALDELRRAGCQTRVYRPSSLKGHEKALITDHVLIIGSQNLSPTSLDKNRELSLRLDPTAAPAIASEVERVFAQDFQAGEDPR